MNETEKEKITPLKNSEDYEKLKEKYKEEKKQLMDKVEEWKNTAIKSDDLNLEKDKVIERLTEERDDWKKEAHSARKIHQQTKQHKEAQDFETEFIKSQEKKGIKWNGVKWVNQ